MASKKIALCDLLHGAVNEIAPLLLGCVLEREINGETLRVRIVETEAYDQTDAASHSYKGQTERTKVMFGPAGYLYVYFTYGMHYCCNVVVGPEGYGAAVLIRAVEPIDDISFNSMQNNRPNGVSGVQIANGPAKLCQALCIDKTLNGHNLQNAPLRLLPDELVPLKNIVHAKRIGISKAKDMPWRFYIKGNPYVSNV